MPAAMIPIGALPVVSVGRCIAATPIEQGTVREGGMNAVLDPVAGPRIGFRRQARGCVICGNDGACGEVSPA